jgi:predicted ArsR family transcriptional regulator
MVLTLLKDISRPHVIDIVMLLKRGNGMSVNEISAALRMSYMGIKQHCVFLEKKGYLSTWMRPKPGGGRPEKMYCLTAKMNELFPNSPGAVALEMVQIASASMGDGAVQILLRGLFENREQRYVALVKGRSLLERAQSLAKQRMNEGCVSLCEFDAHQGLRIVEHHTPLVKLMERYPVAGELEALMFARVLRCDVERLDMKAKGFTHIEFRLKNAPE